MSDQIKRADEVRIESMTGCPVPRFDDVAFGVDLGASDQTIEQGIQVKGLTAPRVTPADIEANIAGEYYFTAADGFRLHWLTEDHPKHDTRASVYDIASNVNVRSYASTCASIDATAGTPQPLGLLTFCVLVLCNGFTVTGESACASPENFDAELGRKIARQNAINKVWPLMGYHLKQKLAES